MPGRVAKKPSRFTFSETHVLMSQRKDKSLNKMEQRKRQALSRKNKKEAMEKQKQTDKENNKKAKTKKVKTKKVDKTGGAVKTKKVVQSVSKPNKSK